MSAVATPDAVVQLWRQIATADAVVALSQGKTVSTADGVVSLPFGQHYATADATVTLSPPPSGPFTYAPIPNGTRFSSLNSFWYKPLPSNAVRLSNSPGEHWYNGGVQQGGYLTESSILTDFARQLASTYPLINKNSYTLPLVAVPADQPLVRIALPAVNQTYDPNLQTALNSVPAPASIVSSPGDDGSVVFYSASTDTFYEFWQYSGANQTASWAGVLYNAAASGMGAYPKSPSYVRAESWGASASGLISACGFMQWEEWITNHAFNHALTIASWGAQQGYWYPAWKGDGTATQNGNAIPHGTIMRFDPALDLTADDSFGAVNRLGLSPFAAAMARAIQTYGLVFTDGSGTVNCYAEDITANTWSPGGAWWDPDGFSGGANGYTSGPANPNDIMNQVFSATMRSHLQVLSPAWVQAQGIAGP